MAASPSTTPSGGGDFFDDDNNKAMYLVLPAMILIYGSCCLVYCIHKCRRYCIHQSRKKQKAGKRRMLNKHGMAFDNHALSHEYPSTSGHHPTVVLTLESLEQEQPMIRGPRSRATQETDVDSLVDVLQKETVSGVPPGYAGASMNQEMQHLDNQLKAAFRLTNVEGVKSTSQEQQQPQQQPPQPLEAKPHHSHEVITAYLNWKTLQKTQPPKLEVRNTATGDTVVVRIPKEKRLKMVQEKKGVVHPQADDIAAMLEMREKLNKPMPRSIPDILKRPDENVTVLKKISLDAKRRIFLSSQ